MPTSLAMTSVLQHSRMVLQLHGLSSPAQTSSACSHAQRCGLQLVISNSVGMWRLCRSWRAWCPQARPLLLLCMGSGDIAPAQLLQRQPYGPVDAAASARFRTSLVVEIAEHCIR